MKFFLYLIRTLLNAMGFFVQPGKLYIFLFFDEVPANAMGFFKYTLICSLRVRKTPCVLRFINYPSVYMDLISVSTSPILEDPAIAMGFS